MGVDYYQKAIVGVSIFRDDCRTVLEGERYEDQNRYDVKTGQFSHIERVKVKEMVEQYSFKDVKASTFGELAEFLQEKYQDLDVCHDDDYIYIGIDVGESQDYGRVTLKEESLSFMHLAKRFSKLEKRFPEHSIELHLFGVIG